MVKYTKLDLDEMCAKAEGRVDGEGWDEREVSSQIVKHIWLMWVPFQNSLKQCKK